MIRRFLSFLLGRSSDQGWATVQHRVGHRYTFKGSDEQLAVSSAKARDQRERQRQRIAAGKRTRKADQVPTKLRAVK